MINSLQNLTLPSIVYPDLFLEKNENSLIEQQMKEVVEIKHSSTIQKDSFELLEQLFRIDINSYENKQFQVYEQNNTTTKNISNIILMKTAQNTVNDRLHGKSNDELILGIENKKNEIINNYNNLKNEIANLAQNEQDFINNAFKDMQNSLENLKESFKQVQHSLKQKPIDDVHISFSLDLRTKDGDSIGVNMKQSKKYTSYLNIKLVNGKPEFTVNNSMKEIFSLEIDAKGNLDAKEQKLLNNVIVGVNNILNEWKTFELGTQWSGWKHHLNLDESQISEMYSSESYRNNNIRVEASGGGKNPNQIDPKQYNIDKIFEKLLKDYEDSFKQLFDSLLKIDSIESNPKQIIKDITKSILQAEETLSSS